MQWITLQSLGTLPKSLEHALGYIWDKLGAFTLISAKDVPKALDNNKLIVFKLFLNCFVIKYQN